MFEKLVSFLFLRKIPLFLFPSHLLFSATQALLLCCEDQGVPVGLSTLNCVDTDGRSKSS